MRVIYKLLCSPDLRIRQLMKVRSITDCDHELMLSIVRHDFIRSRFLAILFASYFVSYCFYLPILWVCNFSTAVTETIYCLYESKFSVIRVFNSVRYRNHLVSQFEVQFSVVCNINTLRNGNTTLSERGQIICDSQFLFSSNGVN